jgi:helix-turn-helix protein
MSSKQFTAQVFAWLRQINRGPYLAADLKVALELTEYFNEKDQGGRAYPSYKTLGHAIGLSEQTVIRSIDRMRAQGDLRVISGKAGRGHPNQYWMVVKPAQKTFTVTEVFEQRRKPSSGVKKTSIAAEENHLKNHNADGECLRTPPSAGERVRTACEQDLSPSAGTPPLTRDPAEHFPRSDVSSDGEKEDSAFRDLRALWRRGWASDDEPKAQAIARQAFERACREAEPDEILEGAKRWIAAADAPRYLPALPQWLAGRGWEKPPPTGKTRRSHGGPQRGNGARQYGRKPSLAAIAHRLAEGYEAERAERERERGVS